MSEGEGFFHELVRRKVVRVGLTYVAAAWVLVQVADVALDSFGAPDYFMQAFMLFALLGLPVVLILAWTLEVTPRGILSDGAARAMHNSLRPAIAVLPFSNMSSDAEMEYLADGLTDHLITECQQHLPLPVTSRNSTFVYKNQPIAIPVAARELNVAYILEGSVQKQEDTIRVTAQLIHGADDSHLWAEHFDKKLEDVFAVQDELTRSIVGALGSTLAAFDETGRDAGELADGSPGEGLIQRIARLPAVLTVPVAGAAVLAVILLLAFFAPTTLRWTEELATVGMGWVGLIAVITSLAALFGFFWMQRRRQQSQVMNEVVPAIENHIRGGHFHEAFDLAEANTALLPDRSNTAWWDQFSAVGSINCSADGSTISYRPYNGRNVEWRAIKGSTSEVRLPLGNLQLLVSAPGYRSQEFCTANPGVLLNNEPRKYDESVRELAATITLVREDDAIDGMLYAASRHVFVALVGLPAPPEPVIVEPFFIDRYPVSNAEYLEFVQGGGYAGTEWSALPWPEGTDWQAAVATFVDATGRPGPSGWELGRPRTGEEGLPVTGVSWYEALAYAGSKGKKLPTVYEWARAALPFDSNTSTINVPMMQFSNFFGNGVSGRGEYPSMNGIGTFDMFGNVREWAWNEVGDGRGNLGGCHSDEPYYAVWLNKDDPLTRSPDHGFRCVVSTQLDEYQAGRVSRTDRSYEGEFPVSDEAYATMIESIIPHAAPTNLELMSQSELGDSRHILYEIDGGYGERFPVSVIRPSSDQNGGALVVFPGMGAFFGGEAQDDVAGIYQRLSFVAEQLGYAFIMPRFTGMYERADGGPFPRSDFRAVWTTRAQRWTQELTQAIELAKELPELVPERIGFLGISYGAIFTTSAIALHPQLKTIVLLSGNMQSTTMIPINDSINYYPRITAPVLMMNGRFDSIVSPNQEILQLRLDLLGTPEEHKRQILYDAGHFPYPQHLFKKDLSDWLEEYL